MTNKTAMYMPNRSTGVVTVTGTAPNKIYTISGGLTGFIYDSNNGIPRIGDLVSSSVSGTVPADTRVATASVSSVIGANQSIAVTLDKDTTLVDGNNISISENPDYDVNWAGDSRWLEDKFIRFSYRFKYEDNEYSVFAPFSQPMFIPKQYAQFGGGSESTSEDMTNAYKSTIVSWFENNVNNIGLKIPMNEATSALMISDLLVTDIDILYKESDALAVKVLETVNLTGKTFTSISYKDAAHGENTKYYLDYNYNSSTPYKTLPSNQVTRVSDKVPIKALAQEVIGNRIVYGNYLDRHSSPSKIAFSASAQNKSTTYDNHTQYPTQQLKKNRTYQVGFVLSDRYGRQSDVILSSFDTVPGTAGSTVFHSYNNLDEQTTAPVIDWLGDALSIQLNEAIGVNPPPSSGQPGVYSIDNPLGWYSYKIVVKQQEQEYYNVYLPGFINGYPVITDNERNKSIFTTLIGDNINKIPRDLSEVGPSDREYNSSEVLYIRVNNPDIGNKPVSGQVQHDYAWNQQYYPNNVSQDVLSISTVREMEIASIPFVALALEGEYGSNKKASEYFYDAGGSVVNTETTTIPTGSIPWGKVGPDPAFYNADSNPLVVRIDSSSNANNFPGARVTSYSINPVSPDPPEPAQTRLSMVPVLSVAETKPDYSLLDIFWETSLSGNLTDLNALISAQYGGLVGTNFAPTSFPESTPSGDQLGVDFNFKNGGGVLVAANAITINPNTTVITNQFGATVPVGTFVVAVNGTASGFEVRTGSAEKFFYSTASLNRDIYTISFETSYNDGTTNYPADPITLSPLTLTNVAPVGINCSVPSGISSGTTIIKTFTVTSNGSIDTSGTPPNNTLEMVWSIDGIPTAGGVPISGLFEISSTGVLSVVSGQSLVNNTEYELDIKVIDVNGNSDGLASYCNNFIFTAGIQHVPVAICEGRQGGIRAICGETSEWLFTADATSTSSADVIYNVKAAYNTATTGKLTQGVMTMSPTLTTTCISEDSTINYTVEYRLNYSSSWTAASCDVGSPGQTAGGAIAGNAPLIGSYGLPGTKEFHFSIPGEYRVWTDLMQGEACTISCGTSEFYVDFGDKTYPAVCTGPL
jgi:hypothetical protein